ncbi:MAG: hypothetical protein IJJ29_02160 [Solobacterium sp.]|nr:hypothetical protein [Solobacterium sp.]
MKRYIIPAVSALILTLAGCWLNYRHFQQNKWLLWSLKSHGGEFTGEWGFGWRVSHIYGMMPGQHDQVGIHFDPLGFLLTFLCLFLIISLGMLVYKKIRMK